MSGALETVRRWFRRRAEDVEDIAKGGLNVSVQPPGAGGDEETSTNAQLEGTADEPWPDRD